MVSRKKRLRNNAFMIVVVLILLAASFAFLFFRDSSEVESKNSSFELPDVCGIVSGNMFHSVPDDNQCRVQCLNKCRSLDVEFKSSEFDRSASGCHNCKCNCE